MIQYNTSQHKTISYNTIQYHKTKHNTQHNTKHNTTQHISNLFPIFTNWSIILSSATAELAKLFPISMNVGKDPVVNPERNNYCKKIKMIIWLYHIILYYISGIS